MKKLCYLFLCLLIFLTGCVRYEVGINFPQAHSGTIIQHIKLGQQLTSFSQVEGNAWLDSIERRAIQLQGKTKKISAEEIVVTIPFNNGRELVSKFNKFFQPSELKKNKNNSQLDDLLELQAQMSIKQSNLLLLERNVLSLRTDLRSLGVISNQGNVIISPGDLIDIELQFKFPWGGKLVTEQLSPGEKIINNQLNVELQAGQINQIKTIFWLPNYVGLGTVAIALFILGGFYLKYKQLPLID
jgi:hypothetical protein